MGLYLVAVIDGTIARFFELNPDEVTEYEAGPHLVERKSLFNAEQEMHGRELWANTQTGRNRVSAGPTHNYDDHRSQHMVEFERRFAQSITQHIGDLQRDHAVRHLVLVAEPQILGILREVMPSHLPPQLHVQEVTKDLCKLKAQDIHDYLAQRSLIPAFHRARL